MISKQEDRDWQQQAKMAKPFTMTAADKECSDRMYNKMYDALRTPNFLPEQNKAPVPKRHPASQAFHDLCDAMKAMHDKKQQDYGRANDPFSNVRASEDFGIPGWAGAMMRANDKMRRIQKAASGGTLSNEGVEDSLMDLAVYSIIALVLYRETCGAVKGQPEPMVRWDQPAEMYAPGRFVQQENGEVHWIPAPERGQ